MRRFDESDLGALYAVHPQRAETILARLGRDRDYPGIFTEDDLSSDDAWGITDQNHIGGAKFALELGRLAGVDQDSLVLDIGTGLGGTARVLADRFSCRVIGVELVEDRYRDALLLTRLVKLDQLVSFVRADFMRVEFHDAPFDVLISQGSLVHFQDKQGLARRSAKLLKPCGRLAIEDASLRRLPADAAELSQVEALEKCWLSHLVPLSEWLEHLRQEGFAIDHCSDLSSALLAHQRGFISRSEAASPDAYAENEVRSWKLCVALVEAGLVDYHRVIARRQNAVA